jgi:membrane-associated phospholipid phosphatase
MTKRLPKSKSLTQANSKTKPDVSFLSAIDFITLAFCGWILAYMSIGINRVFEPWKHLPIYLGIAMVVLIMAWLHKQDGWNDAATKRAKLLSFIRAIYPVLLFGYFFTSSHAFNRIIFTDWLDPWFMNIDNSLFGYLPSLQWGLKYDNLLLQELFHGAYFCYYPMIVGLPIYLYFKQPKAFKELIFNLTFVFYLCYTIYSVLPVIGGRYIPEAMEITRTYAAGPFTHIMVFIYRHSNHLGGAFPSSHIAITLVLTVAALRFVRPMGLVFTIIAFFLSIATVYCHYHWFIDAVFGILTGIAGYYLANYTRSKLNAAGFY